MPNMLSPCSVRGRWRAALTVVLLLASTAARAQSDEMTAASQGCGGEIACPVTLPNGEPARYYSVAPRDWDGQSALPTIVWFHGYRGSGLNEIRNRGLVEGWTDAGYLFVAADGARNTWSHQGSPSQARDDLTYVAAVAADVARRYPTDDARFVAAGFSQGGSMVWSLACFLEDRFSHFAPVAGAFWRPLPERCESGGLVMRHTHGTGDGVVPLAGRPIGQNWHQGDVFLGMGILRGANQCPPEPDLGGIETGQTICREWGEACDSGELQLCLHDGGHRVPAGWGEATRAWIDETAAR